MIDFNRPAFTGKEFEYIQDAVNRGMLCGDGIYTKKCSAWMEERFHVGHVMLTTSCTHALEMAAFLADIHPGDEVIMPSYTFVSTADAFVLRGAKIVFVDIRPDTMNIDEKLIEQAITEKTRAIVPVHYAGVACEMDTIMDIARRHNLKVVEDAAQGVDAYYKGKALGTIGDFGCYSFHETKNYTMGEGGAILFNGDQYQEKAEILREKGTDRSKFFRGQVDKYRWMDYGSSYLPSELNAAYLYAQLEQHKKISDKRMQIYNFYNENLKFLADIQGKIGEKEIRQAMSKVGLDPDNKTKVDNYSLGMKQKLGIAQAIMEGQDILILDEPFNALDYKTYEDVKAIIRMLKAEGKTIFLTSHHFKDIEQLCDQVYSIEDCRLIPITEEIAARYREME